jgi:6-phosphogluconolactonase
MLVSRNAESLAQDAALWLCQKAEESDGRFTIALSGGATPKRLYEHLASPEFLGRFPWRSTHWFWGDERFVPRDHPDSNFKTAWDALLARAPIPSENMHPVPTVRVSPHEAAKAYAAELALCYGSLRLDPNHPLFDVVLLGLGEDGHTASLFPGSPVLKEHTKWTAAVIGEKPESRITLTYPALNSCRYLAFLVSGKAKASILAAVLRGDDYPATWVNPRDGVTWLVDQSAYPGRSAPVVAQRK